jgi:hypothetical protein
LTTFKGSFKGSNGEKTHGSNDYFSASP